MVLTVAMYDVKMFETRLPVVANGYGFYNHLCSLLIGSWWLHLPGRGAGGRPLCLSQSLLLLALSSPELNKVRMEELYIAGQP